MRKLIAAHARRCDVYYYRDQRAREIDFVLDRGGKLSFVEAKWTEQPGASDARTIHTLDAELRASPLRTRPGKHAIICRTPHAFPIDEHVMAVPHHQLMELFASKAD